MFDVAESLGRMPSRHLRGIDFDRTRRPVAAVVGFRTVTAIVRTALYRDVTTDDRTDPVEARVSRTGFPGA